ncbi:MAG: PmoA family protein [Pirellulales bacterium]|nr:PmoA family protein [Pirellulales bacterium]
MFHATFVLLKSNMTGRAALAPLCGLMLLVLPGPSSTFAAEGAPVLVVPSAKRTLHVAVPLPEGFTRSEGSGYCLVEEPESSSPVPVQIVSLPAEGDSGSPAAEQLLANVPPRDRAPALRRFRLQERKNGPACPSPFALLELNGKSLQVKENGKPRFVYNFDKVTNPKVPAKDPRRSRSGYVHPLYGLGGEVLTDDFPRDHYHHHGLFWAWPHVKIGGKSYDLWMAQGIRQDFVRWLGRDVGPVAAVLDVENGWFVGDKKVMVERVLLRAFRGDRGSRVLDVQLTLIPQGEPVNLRGAEEKGYGGLTLRLNVREGKWKQAVITTPLGVSAQDLPETRLAWADLTYPFRKNAPSGVAIFIPKDHPDYPPMWLTRHYGPLCVGYPGIDGKTFPPGQPIRLNYRLLIHAGALSPEAFKRHYADYLLGGQARWE